MVEQDYLLDMIPGESTPPVVHVSQYDVNARILKFNLMKGGVAYVPDVGMTVTLDGTKPDNTAFSYPMTVDGSTVSIECREQMTVVAGHVKCEVTVSSTAGTIASANFILAVEESAIDTGAISETDIPIFIDLKNQAQQAAADAQESAEDAAQSAEDAEEAADSVSAIMPASAGTAGQVLTKTPTGADWDDVDGLPAGGTVGQVLTKNSGTDGDASWQTPQSGASWGSITGTLSNQTDLQTALNAKITTPSGGSVGQVLTKTASGTEWSSAAGGGTWGSITGTLSNQTDLQNALNAKQNIYITKNKTLLSASWSSSTYTISDSDITASNVIIVTYPATTSDSDYEIIKAAGIRATAQSAGSITLKATGEVPTSNIVITLIIWG